MVAMDRADVAISVTRPPAQHPPAESAFARFLRYAAIDTQSAEDVATVPSTPTQWDLARLLVDELHALGAQDVWLSDTCVVYATIPSNLDDAAAVPVIGLIAHMDTAPAVSGANINVISTRTTRAATSCCRAIRPR